jgi:putative transposase
VAGQDQSSLVGQIESGNEATGDIMPDNAFIEVFNGRFRAERLNAHWFLSLADARKKLEDWRRYYNEERPHGAIRRSRRLPC